MRVGASHKNPTRRWRYKNKTIVLFFMDSSIIYFSGKSAFCQRERAAEGKASPADKSAGDADFWGLGCLGFIRKPDQKL